MVSAALLSNTLLLEIQVLALLPKLQLKDLRLTVPTKMLTGFQLLVKQQEAESIGTILLS